MAWALAQISAAERLGSPAQVIRGDRCFHSAAPGWAPAPIGRQGIEAPTDVVQPDSRRRCHHWRPPPPSCQSRQSCRRTCRVRLWRSSRAVPSRSRLVALAQAGQLSNQACFSGRNRAGLRGRRSAGVAACRLQAKHAEGLLQGRPSGPRLAEVVGGDEAIAAPRGTTRMPAPLPNAGLDIVMLSDRPADRCGRALGETLPPGWAPAGAAEASTQPSLDRQLQAKGSQLKPGPGEGKQTRGLGGWWERVWGFRCEL